MVGVRPSSIDAVGELLSTREARVTLGYRLVARLTFTLLSCLATSRVHP